MKILGKYYVTLQRRICLIIFSQDRFYPDVEFYGWKMAKNIYLTDIKARVVCGRRHFISYNMLYKNVRKYFSKKLANRNYDQKLTIVFYSEKMALNHFCKQRASDQFRA